MLDRCGRHFGLVLNFLRDGSVPLPEDHRELDEVLKEAQFYQVQGLIQHCLSAMQVKNFTIVYKKKNYVYIIDSVTISIQDIKRANMF